MLLLRIFPLRDDVTNTWYSPANISGAFKDNDSVFVHSILPLYLQSVIQGSASGKLLVSDESMCAMKNFKMNF
jgi:hypothetical protein